MPNTTYTINLTHDELVLIFLGLANSPEEMDENLFAWTVHFFIDKALGISTCFVVAKLYKRWSKIDPWIMACDKLCDDIMDNPNPNKL